MKPHVKPEMLLFLRKGFFNVSGVKKMFAMLKKHKNIDFYKNEKKEDNPSLVVYKFVVKVTSAKSLQSLVFHSVHDSFDDAKEAVLAYIKHDIVSSYLMPQMVKISDDITEWKRTTTKPEFVVAQIIRNKYLRKDEEEKSWGVYKYKMYYSDPGSITNLIEAPIIYTSITEAFKAAGDYIRKNFTSPFWNPYLGRYDRDQVEWYSRTSEYGKITLVKLVRYNAEPGELAKTDYYKYAVFPASIAGVAGSMKLAKEIVTGHIVKDSACQMLQLSMTTDTPELVEWHGKYDDHKFLGAIITHIKESK